MDNLDITAFIEKIKDTYTVLQQLEIIKEYFNTFSDKTNEVIDNVNNIQVYNYEHLINNPNEQTININKENLKILLINATFYDSRNLKIGEITINDYKTNTNYTIGLFRASTEYSYLGSVNIKLNTEKNLLITASLNSINSCKCIISVLYK